MAESPKWVVLTQAVFPRRTTLRTSFARQPDVAARLGAFTTPRRVDALTDDERATADELTRLELLHEVRPFLDVVQLEGEPTWVDAARAHLEHAWARPGGWQRLVFLGDLGTPDWWERLRALDTGTPALTISGEGQAFWLGPELSTGRTPCPVCLYHRRLPIGLVDAPAARPLAGLDVAVQVAAALTSNRTDAPPDGLAWQVFAYHPIRVSLLPSTQCRRCHPASPRPLSEQAALVRTHVDAALARPPADEPDEAFRHTLTDLYVGPAMVHSEDRPGSFGDGLFSVGGVRALAWDGDRQVIVDQPNAAFGAGLSATQRERVLVAELLERLALITQRPDVRDARFDDVAEHLAPLDELLSQTDSGAPPPNCVELPQAKDWSWMVELATRTPRLVPFDALVAGRPPRAEAKRVHDEPFFTGGATHRSARLALEHALLEVTERDAFMVAWYLRLPLARLGREGPDASSPARPLFDWLRARGLAFTFLSLSVDSDVPVVLTVAEATKPLGRWQPGGVVLSGCAGTTVERAIERGVVEVAGQYTAVGLAAPSARPANAAWISLFERLLSSEGRRAVSFLDGGARPASVSPREVAGDVLAELVARLHAQGTSPLARLHDTDEVHASGLTAVQVLVPGFLKPARTRAAMRFPRARLARLATRWGVADTLNPDEHPQA